MSQNEKPFIGQEEKKVIESRVTKARIRELEDIPVKGNFDIAHLKEVHRRIFQDLPALGIENPMPGAFRTAVPEGDDWVKKRPLKSLADEAFSFVCYSPMDKSAHSRLDKVLQGANPKELRTLNSKDFTKSMAELYAQLDYVHPFTEGNSRTLRVFTQQLARASGYELDWNRSNTSDRSRDFLYIARAEK